MRFCLQQSLLASDCTYVYNLGKDPQNAIPKKSFAKDVDFAQPSWTKPLAAPDLVTTQEHRQCCGLDPEIRPCPDPVSNKKPVLRKSLNILYRSPKRFRFRRGSCISIVYLVSLAARFPP